MIIIKLWHHLFRSNTSCLVKNNQMLVKLFSLRLIRFQKAQFDWFLTNLETQNISNILRD